MRKTNTETDREFKPALAARLYKDGVLWLGTAAKLSELPLTEFINHSGSLGIEIVQAGHGSLEQKTL